MLSNFLRRGRDQRGFSQLELIVAAMVLAILATAVVPLARWDDKRRREARLKLTLQQIRVAVDQYKKSVDEGMIIPHDVEQMGYPATLEELVEGVDFINQQSEKDSTISFLPRIPVDPFTDEATWGLRSYQDDWDSSSWGGENVYDVYSLSHVMAMDGTYYYEW
jgi:general secretion pathway protein G